MFVYEKKLQYPVNIKTTNPKLAKIVRKVIAPKKQKISPETKTSGRLFKYIYFW